MSENIDNLQWPLNSVLVSHKHRVMYTPIAKVANTSLKRMFVRFSGYPQSEEILGTDVHTYLTTHRTGLSLCDYTREEAAEILRDESFFRYVVLRDPLARAVSGYLEKFVFNPLPGGANGEAPMLIGAAIAWVYAQRGETPNFNRSITFEEFVNYVAQNDDMILDTHFKSQDSYLVLQKFDFVGALEKRSKLIEVLESRFKQKIKLEHWNPTRRRKPLLRRRDQAGLLPSQLRAQRTLPHASELLSDEIAEQLKQRYVRDNQLWTEAVA